jgi:short-subunit dehydrogenase
LAYEYRDKTALITGASSGIGAAFARALAARGTDLILVARSENRLQRLAEELMQRHGVRAAVIQADLATLESIGNIRQAVRQKGMRVDMLINNAGFGTYGRFERIDGDSERAEILVNNLALVELTRAFLGPMLEHGAGSVINVASTSAFQPTPNMAVYGASKAFVLSFSEALWAENRDHGVRVLALCPGPTATRFFEAMGGEGLKRFPPRGLSMPADKVVEKALRALERGRSFAVPGSVNYAGALSTRLGSRALVARMAERIMRPQHR